MGEILASLRELNIYSLVVRLVLAMLLGGMIGIERGKKRRAAGFRTYLLVSMGAALTMLLGQYFADMQSSDRAPLGGAPGISADISRLGAQVINGIGFLGAGTIIVTGRQEVKGLTTAAGLWASACMGLAVGAGFYECVLLAFLLILLSIRALPYIENYIIENSRNINIYVEFESIDDFGSIISLIKRQKVSILDVEIDRGSGANNRPSACFVLRLQKKMKHVDFLTAVAENQRVCAIEEL